MDWEGGYCGKVYVEDTMHHPMNDGLGVRLLKILVAVMRACAPKEVSI